ncbi:hypothetical protein AVEN_183585-1 [Araneus ventricosus]|uniref:Uncharacterized protein n=1 Tax=Araneus ventricosus TaxID=182803 RepID=A0A4Y2Q0Y1_ARAVE|nr:hypothetical protein AVEN_183585-1 [Araneus ventricosus]
MIRVTRSSAESTGVSYTKYFICAQKKKSSGLRSDGRGVQVTDLPRPIHRAGYVALKKCRTSCLGDMLRMQVQNDVRGDDLFTHVFHSRSGMRPYVPW